MPRYRGSCFVFASLIALPLAALAQQPTENRAINFPKFPASAPGADTAANKVADKAANKTDVVFPKVEAIPPGADKAAGKVNMGEVIPKLELQKQSDKSREAKKSGAVFPKVEPIGPGAPNPALAPSGLGTANPASILLPAVQRPRSPEPAPAISPPPALAPPPPPGSISPTLNR